MKPVTHKELTVEQHWEELVYLMFLKQKRHGKVKAYGCVDGCKQCPKVPHHESTLPAVAIGAVFLIGLIDAKDQTCLTLYMFSLQGNGE